MRDEIQVVIHHSLQPAFDQWLRGRKLKLFPIPIPGEPPTYGITWEEE